VPDGQTCGVDVSLPGSDARGCPVGAGA